MEQLNSCPFCGKTVELDSFEIKTQTGNAVYTAIYCFRCGIQMSKKLNNITIQGAEKIIASKWNRRANSCV